MEVKYRYHEQSSSPVSKLISILNQIYTNLTVHKHEFTSEESQKRYEKFALAFAFKEEFWYWSRVLHLKMKMDWVEEVTPIVYDDKGRFYMRDELKYMTVDNITIEGWYNFFYDYIQGNLEEYRVSEDENESYYVDQSWTRRLNSTLRALQGFDQVEVKKIVSKQFRKEVEETEQEVLLFLISEKCDFWQSFIDENIINDFAKTVKWSPHFKIMIMDVLKNDLPEEYALYSLPQIMFTGKEKEKYRPKTWKNKKYDLNDLRKFLHQHSEEFKNIDKTKRN